MKTNRFLLAAIFGFALSLTFSCSSGGGDDNNSNSSVQGVSSSEHSSSSDVLASSSSGLSVKGPVSYYGKLQASGKNIVGSKTGSTAVQVRGVSLGWSNTGWSSAKFFNATTVNAMVDGWKAEIIRVPMGYANIGDEQYYGSYLDDKTGNMNRVKAAIDAAIAKDIYVIIDWHSHKFNQADASAYFEEMAKTYGSYPNVIFEIFNEPLPEAAWSSIKSYATEVIKSIRKYSTNLVLVGTPSWDQEVDVVVGSALTADNVAYVLHFYANHSFRELSSRINNVRSAGYPVFVSEYGTADSDGVGPHNASVSDTWMSFLNSNNISYCAWMVNNIAEVLSFFKTTFPSANAEWANTSNMTASGQYIYNNLVSWSSQAPWRGGSGN